MILFDCEITARLYVCNMCKYYASTSKVWSTSTIIMTLAQYSSGL